MKMRINELLLATVAACLVLGASGAAQAQKGIECGAPGQRSVINDETILQDVTVLPGDSCIINDSTIKGFVVGDSPNTILIYNSKVENRIVIDNANTVAISDVLVDDGNIDVSDSDIASVVDNRANDGDINVTGNIEAYVVQNDAEGRIVCGNNTTLVESFNTAGAGGDQCRD